RPPKVLRAHRHLALRFSLPLRSGERASACLDSGAGDPAAPPEMPPSTIAGPVEVRCWDKKDAIDGAISTGGGSNARAKTVTHRGVPRHGVPAARCRGRA